MNDLQEQIAIEHSIPDMIKKDKALATMLMSNKPQDDQKTMEFYFEHYCKLYIKYIEIFRKLEECYDQISHPQKKESMKLTLDLVIARIIELKKQMVEHNNRPKYDYINLDTILTSMKIDPSALELPIPHYFKEDDRITYKIKFPKEKGKKKKKKKKSKKKKKKKKKEFVVYLSEKRKIIDTYLNKIYSGNSEPRDEENDEAYTNEISMLYAIRIIQKNERGRQYRARVVQIINITNKKYKELELQKKLKDGIIKEVSDEVLEKDASLFIQRRLRGYLARKIVSQMRQEELGFLGIAHKQGENKDSAIIKMKENAILLKLTQKERMEEYEQRKRELEDEILRREKEDIKNQKKEELDLLISNYLSEFGKYPGKIKDVIERNDPEKLTDKEPEEDETKGKKGEKKKEKKEKKAGKKKKGDEEEALDKKPRLEEGPSDVVAKFDDQIKLFTDNWSNKDESSNFEQKHDDQLIKASLRPEIEKKIEKEVEAQAELELKNRKILKGIKGGKGKHKKKKKKEKEEGDKEDKWKPPKLGKKPLPGQKAIKDKATPILIEELIGYKLVYNPIPVSMEEFIGTHNFIGSIVDVNILKEPPNPSYAQIRELVTEHAILPLGSKIVRERTAEPVKTMMFLGQPGSGKTMMSRIIAHEAATTFINMSPDVLEELCTDKKAEERIVASVMRVAKDLQPSLIYIDDCGRYFPKKKKKKSANQKKGFGKVKKLLDKYIKSFIKDNRILILGCTNEVLDARKDAKKFFKKTIFFPYPDHSNARIMWKYMIERSGGILPADFQLSTLATISDGYTCGIIKKICESVITQRRKQTV